MNVRELSSEEAGRLESFVKGHARGSIEQTWKWGELQTEIPGREMFHVFGVFEGKDLVGSMLVVRQNMGYGKTWLWCPRGPLLPENNGEAKTAWELLKSACEMLGATHGDVFMRVESGALEEDKRIVKGRAADTSYLPENTLVLDLSQTEEDLLTGMSQSCRRNLRKSEKVEVLEAVEKDFPHFYRLLKETAARDGFHVHQEGFYRAFLKLKSSIFYKATLNGKIVGGALMIHFGKTATYYFGASANEAREAKVGHAIQWHAIREAKKDGRDFYDFLGIAPEGDTGHPLAGVTQFKLGFGGKRVNYQKTQVFVYRRFWWLLYKIAKRFGL